MQMEEQAVMKRSCQRRPNGVIIKDRQHIAITENYLSCPVQTDRFGNEIKRLPGEFRLACGNELKNELLEVPRHGVQELTALCQSRM